MATKKQSHFKRFLRFVWQSFVRLLQAVLWQAPWFGIFSGLIWYGKNQVNVYLEDSFGITYYEKIAAVLEKRTNEIADTLSLTNPMRYADYISALSSSTMASAKASVMRQTIHFLNDTITGGLHLIWLIGCLYCVMRIIRHYNAKTSENDIADKVIEKLTPLLEDLKRK